LGVTKEEDIMSEVTVVNGLCSLDTYGVVAKSRSAQLAIRPLMILRPGKDKKGKDTGGDGINIWFRIHLQQPDRKEILTPRVAHGWKIPLKPKTGKARYWRNDLYLQIAKEGACDLRYLRGKVRQGLNIMLDQLVAPIVQNVTFTDKEALVDWCVGQLEEVTTGFAASAQSKTKVKNVAALLPQAEFGFDNGE
jgi:hypothetical protein